MRRATGAFAVVAGGLSLIMCVLAVRAGREGRAVSAAPAQAKPAAAGGRPFINEQVVWDEGEGGIGPHFVYGLAATRKGTALAFCEGRVVPGNNHPHHLLLKRSTDSGKTWSPDIFIERSDGAFFKNVEEEGSGMLGEPGRGRRSSDGPGVHFLRAERGVEGSEMDARLLPV